MFAWYHSSEPPPQFYGDARAIRAHLSAAHGERRRAQRRPDSGRSDGSGASIRIHALSRRFRVGAIGRAHAGVFSGLCQRDHGFRVITDGYGSCGTLFNGGARTDSSFYSHSANVSLSRLAGRHTVKVGGDYRLIGMQRLRPGDAERDVQLHASVHTRAQPQCRRHGRRRRRQPAARLSRERQLQHRDAERPVHPLLPRLRSGRRRLRPT